MDGKKLEDMTKTEKKTGRMEKQEMDAVAPGNSLNRVTYRCAILMQVQPYDATTRPDPVSNYCEYDNSCSSFRDAALDPYICTLVLIETMCAIFW